MDVVVLANIIIGGAVMGGVLFSFFVTGLVVLIAVVYQCCSSRFVFSSLLLA